MSIGACHRQSLGNDGNRIVRLARLCERIRQTPAGKHVLRTESQNAAIRRGRFTPTRIACERMAGLQASSR
jgi:hypothetical protein